MSEHIAIPDPTDEEIEMMAARVLAFMFPNVPETEHEKEVFNKAVVLQIAHEKTQTDLGGGANIPQGASGFTISDFSMSFEKGANSTTLTKRNMCSAAYGLLLREGLLYRGVEGRRYSCL